MSSYNERLYEIFHDLYLAGWNDKLLDDSPTAVPSENQEKRKAKQAITSLTKELVAEAKPKTPSYPVEHPENIGNENLHRGAVIGYEDGARDYRQNLLKALEEV